MSAADDLNEYLTARRSEIDAALLAALPAAPACPAGVADAMRYSVTAGGKRLRPVLCLASAEAVGGEYRAAMPAACALEFIHTYSLIHDDLPAMDNDTLRRGQPTLHVVAGEGMAILAGDGLLTEAFALMAREPKSVDPDVVARKVRIIGIIATGAGAAGMVGGQAIDLACVTPDRQGMLPAPLDADGLRAMHARKTGALIRASAMAGAVMGGGSNAQVDAIDTAASEFGLAFQIVDDVLDVEGASADLGKTAGKDAAAGKPTYPALYGLDASKRMAHECLERAAAALASVKLADSRLLQIGRWIVERSN
jgi:geranylgeranyl diphosphate synthase, type II